MRKIKVYGKIKLYETSAVGIPAYPDAHASIESFSLIKALQGIQSGFVEEANDISGELNGENEMDETISPTEVAETKSETPVEVEEKKSDISEMIAKAIAQGVKEGLDELKTERGLVEKQIPEKAKSLGELAIESGLFVKK
jgi:hypothetical protein